MVAETSFGGMFSLQWVVDEAGYELATETSTGAAALLLGGGNGGTRQVIRARGGKQSLYSPAARGPLHHKLAEVKTPEEALAFVSAYGFLFTSPSEEDLPFANLRAEVSLTDFIDDDTTQTPRLSFMNLGAEASLAASLTLPTSKMDAPFSIGSTGDADIVSSALELAESVRTMLRLIDEYRGNRVWLFAMLNRRLAPRITVKFDFERDSHGNPKYQRPILRVVPYTLAGFIWLQVAEEAVGSRWVSCKQCGTPFLIGKGGRGRSDKVFCSTACNTAASRAAHKTVISIEERKCLRCGTVFKVPSNSRKVYCSVNCKVNWSRQQKRKQNAAPAARAQPKPKSKARAKK